MYQDHISKRIALGLAFSRLPEDCPEIALFRLAYSYRHQVDGLAEEGNEHDQNGLIAAVSRALSYSVGFELDGPSIYRNSRRSIEAVPNAVDFVDTRLDDRSFKLDLHQAAIRLPEHIINNFVYSLGDEAIDHVEFVKKYTSKSSYMGERVFYHQGHLQQAVLNSLLNYAKTATLGVHIEKETDELEFDPVISEIPAPTVSQTRLKRCKGIPPTLRSQKGKDFVKKAI